MARLSLGTNLQSRDGTLTKDALVTNGYVEAIDDKSARVFKRGGLNLVTSLGSGAGQGIINYTNSGGQDVLFAVQNGTLVMGDVPPSAGAWASRTSVQGGGVGIKGAYTSAGGYIWTATGTGVFYKVNRTDTTWVTANANAFGGASFAGGCLVLYQKSLYLVAPDAGSGATKQVWKSADGVTWTQITSSAAFTADAACNVLVYNGRMYYFGGRNDTTNGAIYSSSDGVTWTLVVATPTYYTTARLGYATVVFSGKMWVIGGIITGTEQNDTWNSTDGITWTQVQAAAAFTAVRGPAVVAAGGIMYLFGGSNSSSGVDQVYSSLDGITFTTVSHSGFNNGAWNLNTAYAQGFLFKNQVILYDGNAQDLYPTATVTGSVTLGTVTGGLFDFAKNLDGTQIMAKSTVAAFKLNTATGAVTSISSANYPALTVRGCVYLDGSFYVMEPDGTIWESAAEDCTTWPSTDFITAEFEPDAGVCLSKFNNYVVAFGQWTTQMFWDAANPQGSSLSPVQNGVILIGCASDNSVAQIESTILWMAQRKGQGSTFQKGRFIAMLEGTSYVQISTPDVDRVLDADDLATVYSCVGSFGGHNFYLLSLGTTGATLCYDMTRKMWGIWTRTAAGSAKSVSALTQTLGLATATSTSHGFSDGDPVTVAGANQSGYNLTLVNVNVVDANTFTYPVASGTVTPATGTITATSVTESIFGMVSSCNYNGQQVFQEVSGGNLFSLLDTVYQDNSQPINFKCRTGNQDAGTNKRKFVSEVVPICDLTSATQTALLRYTDNDFQSYSSYRRFDISDVTPRNNRYGSYRRRAWEWRYTGNTRHRIDTLELAMTGEKGVKAA